MAANNIFLVYLLVWSASWPVTLHNVEDDQQKNMGNSDVQAVQTSTGNKYLQTIVITCDPWNWVTGPYTKCIPRLNRLLVYTSIQGRLNSIIGPRETQRTGAPTFTTTHRNNTVNVDKSKYIFIVLVFPTTFSFWTLKTCCTHQT